MMEKKVEGRLLEEMEELRWKVLSKGSETNDLRKVPRKVIENAPKGELKHRMLENWEWGHTFYSSLQSWLGIGVMGKQGSREENAYLVSLAKEYLAKRG